MWNLFDTSTKQCPNMIPLWSLPQRSTRLRCNSREEEGPGTLLDLVLNCWGLEIGLYQCLGILLWNNHPFRGNNISYYSRRLLQVQYRVNNITTVLYNSTKTGTPVSENDGRSVRRQQSNQTYITLDNDNYIMQIIMLIWPSRHGEWRSCGENGDRGGTDQIWTSLWETGMGNNEEW